jgi:hypothetical protein
MPILRQSYRPDPKISDVYYRFDPPAGITPASGFAQPGSILASAHWPKPFRTSETSRKKRSLEWNDED